MFEAKTMVIGYHIKGEGIVKTGLSLIFEVAGDIQKNGRVVLYQSSRGYTSKYEGKIPGPQPLMTILTEDSLRF